MSVKKIKPDQMLSLTILTALIASVSAWDWQDGNNGALTWASGCEYTGGVIGTSTTIGANCGTECQTTSGCEYFTWVEDANLDSSGTCTLADTTASGPTYNSAAATANEANICGYLNAVSAASTTTTAAASPTSSGSFTFASGNNGALYWASGCAYSGSVIGSITDTGANCGGDCVNEVNCAYFSWDGVSNSCVYYSSSATGPIGDGASGAICGYPVTVNAGSNTGSDSGSSGSSGSGSATTTSATDSGFNFQDGNNGLLEWASGCDWSGGSLGNTQTTGQLCGAACASDSGCEKFTWANISGGICEFYANSATGPIGNGAEGAICGYLLTASVSATGTSSQSGTAATGKSSSATSITSKSATTATASVSSGAISSGIFVAVVGLAYLFLL
ncbi:hypothetical protein HK100_005318 [Physocladia obscura]|uniref:Apple domain-containing protein n=1 Tax=Physocladia obscura TaxID=109957 RepID=A0AAD5XMN6_9FUNG|nr:hypothetical protein HK100_005318 [Physocladia obscura]